MGYYDPIELKPHHKQAVRLSLQGYSHEEIGRRLNRHPKHISKLLNSKKALKLTAEYELEHDEAFRRNLAESLSTRIERLREIASLKPELPLELIKLDLETRRKKFMEITRDPALDVSWRKKQTRKK